MNIEQIATSAAKEVWSAGDMYIGPSETSLAEFLRHCLAKLAAQDVEPVGSERYRVEKRQGGFWPYCVVAGTGIMEIFIGHQKQCVKVANALAAAFEDGKFVAQQRTAEACAKVCDFEMDNHFFESDGFNAVRNCRDQINDGKWREYL